MNSTPIRKTKFICARETRCKHLIQHPIAQSNSIVAHTVCMFTVTAHVKGAKINGKRQHHFWSSFNIAELSKNRTQNVQKWQFNCITRNKIVSLKSMLCCVV